MFKCALLLLLSIVAHASAQTKCCVPEQFETAVSDTTGFSGAGTPGMTTGTVLLSYDFTGKKVAEYVNVSTRGVPLQQKLIFDYNKNVMYTIDEKAKTCTKSPPPPLQRCLPAEAKFLGQFYFGSGSNTLIAQSFLIIDPAKNITAILSFTVDCVLVTETVYGSISGVNFLTVVGYIDTTLGIKDPSVFTPPNYCQQAEMGESKSSALVGNFLHGRRPGFD